MSILFLAVCLAPVAACTSTMSRRHLPYPVTTARFSDDVKLVTVPLPVIAAAPNEGVIYGALTAFLLHDRNDEVGTILAPQVNYNENFGTTGTLYGAFYVSPERSIEINLSRSENVNEDYEGRFRDAGLLGGKVDLDVFLYDFTDGSARFFGFGPQSPESGETNFGDHETGVTLSAGYFVARSLQVVLSERLKEVDVRRGAVASLPFTGDRYDPGEVAGLSGFTAHAQGLALVYSTLAPRTFPVRGIFLRAGVEGSARALGGTGDYWRLEGQGRVFIPLREARYVTALKISWNQVRGNDVPFLERSILGGENTLRGYGRNRFIDFAFVALNVEERITLFRWKVFNVTADWEVSPFVDVGQVAESLGKIGLHDLRVDPGFALRAVVRPNIAGRIEVGFGDEGVAVFVGLGYPF